MDFNPADTLSVGLFSLFCLIMVVAVITTFWRVGAKRAHVMGWVIYLGVFSLAVLVLPLPIPLLASAMLSAILISFSTTGWKISQGLSLAALIGFQAFRFPLELILHHWASIETIPETMTWTGQNWDIVTGVLSLVAIPWLNRSRALAWTVQIIGFALLLNVIRVAILSSPLPFSWHLTSPLLLIFHLPYAMIVPLFVAVALGGHLITFRKLCTRSSVLPETVSPFCRY